MSRTATQPAAAARHTGLSQTFVRTVKQPAKRTLYSDRYGSKERPWWLDSLSDWETEPTRTILNVDVNNWNFVRRKPYIWSRAMYFSFLCCYSKVLKFRYLRSHLLSNVELSRYQMFTYDYHGQKYSWSLILSQYPQGNIYILKNASNQIHL